MVEINNTSLIQEIIESKTDNSIKENTLSILTEAKQLIDKVSLENKDLADKFKQEYDDIRNATIKSLKEENLATKYTIEDLKWEMSISEDLSNWQINNNELSAITDELNELKNKIQYEKYEDTINTLHNDVNMYNEKKVWYFLENPEMIINITDSNIALKVIDSIVKHNSELSETDIKRIPISREKLNPILLQNFVFIFEWIKITW